MEQTLNKNQQHTLCYSRQTHTEKNSGKRYSKCKH